MCSFSVVSSLFGTHEPENKSPAFHGRTSTRVSTYRVHALSSDASFGYNQQRERNSIWDVLKGIERMDSLNDVEAWLKSMSQDEPSQTNRLVWPRQTHDDPHVSTFVSPRPNFASSSSDPVHQQTENDTLGSTRTPKDGRVVGHEGSIAMKDDLLSGHTGAVTLTDRGFTCPIQEQGIEDVNQEKRKTPPGGISEQTKRYRAPNWEVEETEAMLKLKLKVLMQARRRGEPVPIWNKEVSRLLYDNHGYDRSDESCTDRWDTVWRSYKAICEYDSQIILGRSDCIRYWVMTQDQRSKHGTLPRAFPEDWYDLIETIALVESDNDLVKKNLRLKKGTRGRIQKNATSTSTQNASTILCDPLSSQARQVTTSTNIPPVAAITQGCGQQHQDEVFKGATAAENDLIARITPFLKKQIEAALKSALHGHYATPPYNQNSLVANPIGNATPYGSQSDCNVNTSLEHGRRWDEDFISELIVEDGTLSWNLNEQVDFRG